MFDPSAHKETYDPERQETANTGFELPDAGDYAVVVTKVQEVIVGAKRTEKRQFRAVILAAPEDLRKNVGQSFPFDLWWDLSKEANARRLAHLCAACGEPKPFDTGDTLELARHTTGVPIRMKIEIEEKEVNGKMRGDVRILFVQHLPAAKRKALVDAPDFGKVVGVLEDRILEAKDFSSPRPGGGGGGGGGRGRAGPPQGSEDLGDDPFADPF